MRCFYLQRSNPVRLHTLSCSPTHVIPPKTHQRPQQLHDLARHVTQNNPSLASLDGWYKVFAHSPFRTTNRRLRSSCGRYGAGPTIVGVDEVDPTWVFSPCKLHCYSLQSAVFAVYTITQYSLVRAMKIECLQALPPAPAGLVLVLLYFRFDF